MNTPNEQDKARSARAYEAGARVTRDRMRREAPMDAAALERIEASDIVVVKGIYDHVELVLDALGLPYLAIEAADFGRVSLSPDQLLVINCPGQLGELKAKYGEEPVALTFTHGRGEVFHLISHYYLQRTELRSARHNLGAEAYATAKGVPMSRDLAEKMEGLCYGDVEAAESSTRLFANIAARKKGRSR